MKDVIVIGGGAGGVPAAVRAAQLGGDVAIVEKERFGGLCMNRGCVPFGHMMVAAGMLGGLSLSKDMGLDFSGVTPDYGVLMKRQNDLIDFMRLGVQGMLKKNRVEKIEGEGRLAGKGMVEVNGKTIPCRNVILATGGKWARPEFAGADLEDVIDTDRLLESERLPGKVLLYGLSPWLLEIAQFLHRYGSEVLVATPEKTVLAEESKTINTRLRKSLKDQGIEIKTQAQILSASRKKGSLEVELSSKDGSEKVLVDRVIHAERTASLGGLGLETVGLDPAGPYLAVNESMETGAEGVYAIGDLTGPPERHYSHHSSEGALAAAENAMGGKAAVDPRTFSRVLFTQPQVACVGLTPREAKRAGQDVLVGAAPFSMNPFGMILAETEGIVEVVADKAYGEILGVHIIGRGACEMIGQAILCIQMEGTLEDLARAAFPHPTLSESLVEAARDALGRAIYLP